MSKLLSLVLCGLIRAYQLSFSSILGRQCRFQPTCSAYGIEAIQKHGPFKGSVLTFKRLLKCHPWPKLGGKSGYDPVP